MKNLSCSVCGNSCKGQQWHNRDTGYGICEDCVDWVRQRETPAYIYKCWGVEGVNYLAHTKAEELTPELIQEKLIESLKEIINIFRTGTNYENCNPYARPEIKKALKFLATLEGKESYLDVKVSKDDV